MKKIDGKLFADMIVQGSDSLSNNADFVDSLNVFPVPDGDTGTNMNLSMSSGAAEVKSQDSAHIGEVGKVFSKGLLMGARGNSGVILSQLFRGFSKSIENESEIDAKQFAKAFQSGVNTAYKAVMKPVEGTILTVARVAGEAAMNSSETTDDIITIMEAVIEQGQKALENTPNQLPVLKEVGVVDSGGQGLMFVYEGFLATLKGEKIEPNKEKVNTDEFINDDHDFGGVMNTEDIVFGYCTEIMVRFGKDKKPFNEDQFREDMSQFGDSLLVISDDEIVKIHVHSETPGEVLTYGSQYGELIKIKIENMREQHREVLRKSADKKIKQEQQQEAVDTAIITISMGEGITKLFKSLGATHVISGGQTMNPSTEDIVKVVKQSGCKNAIILPNNKNIIMAAEQVGHLVDIPVAVVTSKTVSQGLSAMLNLNLEQSIEENKAQMEEAMSFVKSGSVTYAVRDTNIDGITIKKGEYMGIHESSIKVSDADHLSVSKKLIDEMIDEDSEILTIIKGEDASDDEVAQLESYIEENYEDVEVEVHQGDQPIYSFLFSVE
ncbi:MULTISPECIES: fatty acid kinase catalytic subunit FakA [Mammaliicoccus]|uniref:Fatty acid kinase catalytic subunit FakA n=1 Tax=Mammaliicoccus fleurettii TaxID=150056 RepID=A0ABS5MJ73_9STAP|nr:MULTISPECIES: fatty acid kinase catalytic subunit FakA [Mammaliicoccus]MBL0846921.1 fatty acid kinase catalytic subunit FakA [Mammaliicoccus fleurettii]MBS3670884.1 fatty acid kinase catalytic subunit FakA [Mammaliicoccus fleurettii]MBS3695943.1 fatty acid kinase catalytic subunit FakA [Mammaliicoccus fleurettii]MBW0764502.1 DAK2 domain-containing protein [Mammaliicoccus fleurettii]MEB7723521.1 fatty acid kinase catalytic subunit FakA [Mammaliicoccus fleurettii]